MVARFWIWFLFRDVAVRHAGRVPPAGPVLLCVNHPNNLIDSLLVGAVLPRKVHYLATASLFRNPVLAGFLTRAGAIPVYRRDDGPDRADRNADTFVACRQALDAGRVLAIYPEGTTHAEARVQRIKTGAARIALDYETARTARPGDRPLAARARPGRPLVRGPEVLPRAGARRLRQPGPARSARRPRPRGPARSGPGLDRRDPGRHGSPGGPRRPHRRRPGRPRRRGAVPRRAGAPAPGRARPRPGGGRRVPPLPRHRRGRRALQDPRAGSRRAALAPHPALPGVAGRVSRS